MREVSQERLVKDARRVLENPFWIPEVQAGKPYARLHDDHDGTNEGSIQLLFGQDGDAYISAVHPEGSALRFRMVGFGGGNSPRVRNALMILAWAIKLDDEEEQARQARRQPRLPK